MKDLFSCAELAKFKLAGMPGTERAWRDLVVREKYSYIEKRSRGSKGVTKLYAPPPRILKEIREQERRAGNPNIVGLRLNLTAEEAQQVLALLAEMRMPHD